MILLMRFRVSGHSMEPTFRDGQMLLISSLPYFFRQPKVGDVVVIKDPRDPSRSSGQGSQWLLKRIKAIHNRHSGKRSQVPDGTWRNASRIPLRIERFWTSQNDNEYFVAGDNPNSSTDSRTFGFMNKDNILGKVIFA